QQSFSVSQLDQILDFPPLVDRAFTPDPIQLAATTSSNLPITFTLVQGPASIENNALVLTDTGTITVRASQDGNEIYTPAISVERTFKVVKSAQVIDFMPIGSKQYLDP